MEWPVPCSGPSQLFCTGCSEKPLHTVGSSTKQIHQAPSHLSVSRRQSPAQASFPLEQQILTNRQKFILLPFLLHLCSFPSLSESLNKCSIPTFHPGKPELSWTRVSGIYQFNSSFSQGLGKKIHWAFNGFLLRLV